MQQCYLPPRLTRQGDRKGRGPGDGDAATSQCKGTEKERTEQKRQTVSVPRGNGL